jgi:hypothetical protein
MGMTPAKMPTTPRENEVIAKINDGCRMECKGNSYWLQRDEEKEAIPLKVAQGLIDKNIVVCDMLHDQSKGNVWFVLTPIYKN